MIATSVVDRQLKTAGTDPTINGKTNNFKCIKLSRAHDEKIKAFQLQEETDEQPKEKLLRLWMRSTLAN